MSKRKGPKESHKKKAAGKGRSAVPRRKLPNWPLLALSLAGMALTGYLTVVAWAGTEAAYCTAGSGCDLVQESRWATFLGAPVALWGFLTYAALAGIAFRVKNGETHWKFAWTISLVGLAVSLYLTAVSIWVIEATCVYCLTSLGLMAAIFAVVAFQTPRGLPEFRWPGWLAQTGGVAAAVVVGMHLLYGGVIPSSSAPEDPYLRELAEHLSAAEAQFYGASWCPACQRQKELFGNSAHRLPYVECSPGGRNAPPAPQCLARGIDSYPTWIIDGQRFNRVMSAIDLAKITGFRSPGS